MARDNRADVKATAAGQYPMAVVLSCLDSRQPIEAVLDQGIGDIFPARAWQGTFFERRHPRQRVRFTCVATRSPARS